jgi:hypothetical protein
MASLQTIPVAGDYANEQNEVSSSLEELNFIGALATQYQSFNEQQRENHAMAR